MHLPYDNGYSVENHCITKMYNIIDFNQPFFFPIRGYFLKVNEINFIIASENRHISWFLLLTPQKDLFS